MMMTPDDSKSDFCTAVNCMDGRVQKPVIEYLSDLWDAPFVDEVTDAGPVGVLAGNAGSRRVEDICRRVRISIESHGSRRIAVVAHHDCAGNPKPREEQLDDLRTSAILLRDLFPEAEVLALWVGEDWKVEEIGAA